MVLIVNTDLWSAHSGTYVVAHMGYYVPTLLFCKRQGVVAQVLATHFDSRDFKKQCDFTSLALCTATGLEQHWGGNSDDRGLGCCHCVRLEYI